MAGCIKVISSLLLVYIISLNTTNENGEITNENGEITNENGEITNENKGYGQICLTWGGINGTSIGLSIRHRAPAYLFYLLRLGPEYKYFFNRYVGVVSRFGIFDGKYRNGTRHHSSFLSLGVGLEWSYNGTGSKSKIDNTYYGGSIGVIGLWGDMIGKGHKIQFEFDKWGVQVRLTPFKMCKPYGLYMSIDVGCLDIKGLRSSKWVMDGIIEPTAANIAFNIGWSWWI